MSWTLRASALGVEQRPRVAAAVVVAGDDREPAQRLRARGRRRQQREPQARSEASAIVNAARDA